MAIRARCSVLDRFLAFLPRLCPSTLRPRFQHLQSGMYDISDQDYTNGITGYVAGHLEAGNLC